MKSLTVIIQHDFDVNNSDLCVHSKLIRLDSVIICLYVDDILILGTNVHVVNETKKLLTWWRQI